LTGTCYNFEMEEFFSSFCVAWVCQHQLGFLVRWAGGKCIINNVGRKCIINNARL